MGNGKRNIGGRLRKVGRDGASADCDQYDAHYAVLRKLAHDGREILRSIQVGDVFGRDEVY